MRLGIEEGVSETADHWWWRPGWRPGRRMVTLHVTVPFEAELHDLARRTAPVLARLGAFDPVPVHGLHLTMTGVGFTDELDPGQAEQVWDEVMAALPHLEPAPIVLDRLSLGSGGAMLAGPPMPWLQELCQAQREAVDRMRGSSEDRGPFHPHISLAYANGAMPMGQVAEALAPIAEQTPPLTLHRPVLTMMRLGRDTHEYAWDVLAEQELGVGVQEDSLKSPQSKGRR